MSLSIGQIVRKPWGSFLIASALLTWLVSAQVRSTAHPKYDGVHDVQPYGVMGTFWASGDATRKGLNPYDLYPFTFRPHAFFKDGPIVYDPNLNPPSLLPFFSFIARFPLPRVSQVGRYISLLIALVTTACLIWRYQPERKQVWWLLTGGALVSTFSLQQSYTVLFAIAALAWWLLDTDRETAAGICLGLLCAIKPNLILWPVALALAGRRKFIRAAVIVFVLASLIPVVVYGPAVYEEWLRAASVDSHSIFPSDVSLVGNATRWSIGPIGYLLSVLLAIATCILAKFGNPTLREVSALAICASILCSPLGWMHYLLILTPVLISRIWTKSQQLAALLLWVIPVFLEPSKPGSSHWSLAIRGSGYLAGFVILYCGFAREPFQQVREHYFAKRYPSTTRDDALIKHGNPL